MKFKNSVRFIVQRTSLSLQLSRLIHFCVPSARETCISSARENTFFLSFRIIPMKYYRSTCKCTDASPGPTYLEFRLESVAGFLLRTWFDAATSMERSRDEFGRKDRAKSLRDPLLRDCATSRGINFHTTFRKVSVNHQIRPLGYIFFRGISGIRCCVCSHCCVNTIHLPKSIMAWWKAVTELSIWRLTAVWEMEEWKGWWHHYGRSSNIVLYIYCFSWWNFVSFSRTVELTLTSRFRAADLKKILWDSKSF